MARKRGNHKSKYEYDPKAPQSSEEVQRESKVQVEAMTGGQKEYIKNILQNDITICYGFPGTGKTNIAVGLGLQNVYARTSPYKRLIIIRSVIEVAGESLGYLKGDLEQKTYSWLGPILDNLAVYINAGAIECLIKNKQLEIIPIAYLRGRSLSDAFIIVDEAQNLNPEKMLTVLTRIGDNTKLVINGDLQQSDITGREQSGLQDAITRLDGMNSVGIVKLGRDDIVRNPLIAEILYRYDKLNDIEEKENPE